MLCSVAMAAQPETASVDVKIPCFKSEVLLKNIRDSYGEEPMIIGDSAQEDGVTTVVFVSQRKGTYTVVEMNGEIACVLSVGTNVKYRFPKSLNKSPM